MASIIIDEIVPTTWRLRLRGADGQTREVDYKAGTPLLPVRIIVLLTEQQHGRGRTSDRVVSEAIDRVRAPNRRPRAIVLREALQLGLEGPHGRG